MIWNWKSGYIFAAAETGWTVMKMRRSTSAGKGWEYPGSYWKRAKKHHKKISVQKNRGTHGDRSWMLCPTGESNEKPPLQAWAKWWEYVTCYCMLLYTVEIFWTENSVQYSCGSRFCRFGMRSIGKILLQCAGKECPCTVTRIRHWADDVKSRLCALETYVKMRVEI